jgi:hypothetical protein
VKPTGNLVPESMPRVYAAAYLVPQARRFRDDLSKIAADFREAVRANDFPYDVGDDPSFFAARRHGGPVTWGVCRPDVRQAICCGDWMVFFAAEKDIQDSAVTHYRFVAALCVEEKLSHMALFSPSTNIPYRDYLNLLIRPNGSGWEHYEPLFDEKDRRNYHKDWLWRVSRTHRLLKRDVVNAGEQHVPGQPLPLPLSESYVVFSESRKIIAAHPPIVATHKKPEPHETWENDDRIQRIRRLVFKNSCRMLRTSNQQQPHRHFWRQLDDSDWPMSLEKALSSDS